MELNRHANEIRKRGEGMTLSICEPKDGLKPKRFPILSAGDSFIEIRFCPSCGEYLELEDSK